MVTQQTKTCRTCGRTYQTESDFLKGTSRWRLCDAGHLWFNCSCHSTMMIYKGTFDWYSPAEKLSPEAKSFFNRMSTLQSLPHVPTSVMELLLLVRDENATAKQLAIASRKAPLLAGHIIKIANTMKQASGARIKSLEHAITYIGRATLSEITLMASIRSFEFNCQVFDHDQFWKESFLVGTITEELARRLKVKLPPDEAYLAGALANIGKVILAICFPDQADSIARDLNDVKTLGTWSDAETRHVVPKHTILGEIGAAFWGLPDYVHYAALYHHGGEPEPMSQAAMNRLVIVRLANQLSHWLLLQPNRMDEDLVTSARSHFRLSEQDLIDLVAELMPLKDKVERSFGSAA